MLDGRSGWNRGTSARRSRAGPFLFETAAPGVFAVGDVRHGSVKRVASAVGEGSIAIRLVHDYLAALTPAVRQPS
jgi:thioredoxin reductase (NADPH)